MAVAGFDIGNATATATSSFVIPITATVPRSDPTTGATIICVWIMAADTSAEPDVAGVSDDGPTDDFYGTCFMAAGLNPYTSVAVINSLASIGGAFYEPHAVYMGLVLNPLDATNSITVELAGTFSWVFAFARAYTGVQVDTSGTPSDDFPTTDPAWWLDGSVVTGLPLGVAFDDAETANSRFVDWDYNGSGSSLRYNSPGTVGESTDGNWSWQQGDLAVYSLYSFGGATGARTWDDGDIATQTEFDDVDAGLGTLQTMLMAEQPITVPQTGISVDGSWATAFANDNTEGGAWVFNAGPGPTCPDVPPAGGIPVFSHRFRTGD